MELKVSRDDLEGAFAFEKVHEKYSVSAKENRCYRHRFYQFEIKKFSEQIEQDYDRLGLEEQYTEFLGNKVVCHSIPIRPGRNIAIICESAAVNHRQKKMGYNAAWELYNRVTNNLAEKNK